MPPNIYINTHEESKHAIFSMNDPFHSINAKLINYNYFLV